MRARSTGVDIIDEVLGGILPGLPCVLAGPSGSGRTVLSLQLAAAGVEQGRIVSMLCNEPAPLVLRQASSLGLDLTAALESERLALLEMDSEIASVANALGSEALIEAVREEQPLCSLLVVDPLSVVTAGIFDESQLRAMARGLVASAPDWMMVLTVESERLALQQGLERILGEVCGAFLALSHEGGQRRLTVEKTRTGVPRHPSVRFEIGEGGTRLVDAPVEAPVEAPADAPARARVDAPDRAPIDPRDAVAIGTVPPRPAPPRPTAPPGTGVDDRLDPSAAPGSREVAPRRPRPGPAGGDARPVVLVVDSDRASREQLIKWLEGAYEIVAVEDGFEAMTALMTRSPDLVILDLLMPRVTGYELLGAIQRTGRTVPRLVISDRLKRPGDRLAPLVLGATDILAKPLERFELVRKVEMLLRLESPPEQLMDPDEAERLFARITKTRLLPQEEFEARLDRAGALGEKLGLNSSLVAVSSTSSRTIDQLLAAADGALRFEDATLRVSARRAVILLVATEHEDAPGATERLCAEVAAAGGRPDQLTLRIETARRVGAGHDWHALFRAAARRDDDAEAPGGDEAGVAPPDA